MTINLTWKTISALIVSFLLSARFLAFPAYAVSIPSFPACANPQGTIVAKYDSGNHGIVGAGEKSGSDAVYKLSDESLLQCFCGADGAGTQTNWFKASALSEEDIKDLVIQGWQEVIDGAAWGLAAGRYLAINSSYTCQSNTSSSSPSSNSGGQGGSTSSTGLVAASVLSLADTGSLAKIATLLIFGIFSLSTGLLLRKTTKN